MKRILRLSISCAFLCGHLAWLAVQRLLGRKPRPLCTILYYHSIPAHSRGGFARQMEMVRRLCTPVDLESTAPLEPGRFYAAITFDDGFHDSFENGVPELVRRGIPARYFVTAGMLGSPATWWPTHCAESNRAIATAEVLSQLPREWVSVGAHTMTHPYLSRLDEAAARRELLESRMRLEEVMGYPITSMSFPYGDYDDRVVEWCREADYQQVFSSRHEWAFTAAHPYVTGRVSVEPTDGRLEFMVKLLGGYAWLPVAIRIKRWCRRAAFRLSNLARAEAVS